MNMIHTNQFSAVNARACAQSCWRAYRDGDHFGTDLVHGIAIESTIVGESGPQATVLAFRGSFEVLDWVTNARFIRERMADGTQVHRGFLQAIKSATTYLLNQRRAMRAPVFVTGHSQGGALAILAARLFESAGLPVEAVYTFGGPRVGNGRFARDYDQLTTVPTTAGNGSSTHPGLGRRTFRLVLEEDIVPRVPGWLLGYRHVGQEIFMPSLGGMRINPPLWYKCISDLAGLCRGWSQGKIEPISDHPIGRYVEAVGRL